MVQPKRHAAPAQLPQQQRMTPNGVLPHMHGTVTGKSWLPYPDLAVCGSLHSAMQLCFVLTANIVSGALCGAMSVFTR